MDKIIDLLDQKNHFLEKFYTLNENELKKVTLGDFTTIENFYYNREKILDIINYIDAQLESTQANQEEFLNSEEMRSIIKQALHIKNEYVQRILNQDLEMLSCIEIEKSNIIKELGEIQKSKKGVKGYKTPTFNKRLDEEA